jgi:hypothetical protein
MSLLSYLRECVDDVWGRLFVRRSSCEYQHAQHNVYDRDSVRLSEITANDRNGEGW